MATIQDSGKRILLVEDESAICDVFSRMLIGEGFEVDIVVNGKIAEGIIKGSRYELIIVDIKMPVMNGKQLYQSIIERHPDLVARVVFTTGDIMNSDTESFIKQSGRLFLPKPFTTGEFKSVLREALKRIQN